MLGIDQVLIKPRGTNRSLPNKFELKLINVFTNAQKLIQARKRLDLIEQDQTVIRSGKSHNELSHQIRPNQTSRLVCKYTETDAPI